MTFVFIHYANHPQAEGRAPLPPVLVVTTPRGDENRGRGKSTTFAYRKSTASGRVFLPA